MYSKVLRQTFDFAQIILWTFDKFHHFETYFLQITNIIIFPFAFKG